MPRGAEGHAGGYIGGRQLVILAIGRGVTVLRDDSGGVPASKVGLAGWGVFPVSTRTGVFLR